MPDSAMFSLQVATLHHSLPALDFGLLWRRVQEWGGYQQVCGRLSMNMCSRQWFAACRLARVLLQQVGPDHKQRRQLWQHARTWP